jgi:ribosome-associated protein
MRGGGDVATKKSDETKKATKKTGTPATAKKAAKKAPARTSAKPAASRSAASRSAAGSAATKAPAKASVRPASRAKKAEPAPEAPARKDPPSKRIALAIAEAALDKKAVNVQIIDVYGKVDYADYLVVMSGRSDRQVSALARGIAEGVEQSTGERCAGIEGLPEGSWVLMDFGDVVVHIFHDDVRGYYDLESLWIDAGRVSVPGQSAS